MICEDYIKITMARKWIDNQLIWQAKSSQYQAEHEDEETALRKLRVILDENVKGRYAVEISRDYEKPTPPPNYLTHTMEE